MSEILLALILLVTILQWLSITPGSINDYLSWKHRELRRRWGNYWASRRKK